MGDLLHNPNIKSDLKNEKVISQEKVLGEFEAKHAGLDENEKSTLLWKVMLSGNERAFSELFLIHNPKLVTVGIKLGFDKKMVEDCIQDLFINIWLKRENLAEVNSVKYYLVVSLRRALIRQKEKETNIHRLLEGIKYEYSEMEPMRMWNNEYDKPKIDILINSLKDLPARQEEALTLRYIESKTYPEISEIMSVEIGSVRKFVYKALKNLKEIVRKRV